MIYWHVERRSLGIHSQLKSPSSSEVASMIQGVMRHCTEMAVDRHYVDSHGQSTVAFAFTRLLLLCHKGAENGLGARQQGHRGRRRTKPAISRRRSEAIELGTWRSGRTAAPRAPRGRKPGGRAGAGS